MAALSAKLREAEAAPGAVGAKVSETVQAAEAASVAPQVDVCLKADALTPLRAMLESVSEALPVFVRVRVWDALDAPTSVAAKVSDEALTLTAGAGAGVPEPESATIWGEPRALSERTRLALRGPVAVGTKLTETVQVAAGARLAPQVLVWANDVALMPPSAMPARVRGALPVLVRVTAWAALPEPTAVAAKVSDGALRLAVGAGAGVPGPARATV